MRSAKPKRAMMIDLAVISAAITIGYFFYAVGTAAYEAGTKFWFHQRSIHRLR